MGSGGAEEFEQYEVESMQRLERGQLPLQAHRRLIQLVGRPGFSTSGLSPADTALAREAGMRQLSHVLGSCVLHAPWRSERAALSLRAGAVRDIPAVASAWSEARGRA